MASKNGNAAAAEARGAPDFDLLGGTINRENNSARAHAQAAPQIAHPKAIRAGGAKHRRKGDWLERELVDRHKAAGVHAERYPLSGASRFRGASHDVVIYAFKDEPPLVAEIKARKSGAGFATPKNWLGEYDALFLRRNNADPLVVMPWRMWVRLLAKVPR
jgi:hypothetical protein